MYGLEILQKCGKRVKTTKVKKFLGLIRMSVVVADLHSSNFSHTNNTFRRRMLFFNLHLYQDTSFAYRNKEH